jgi:hypothetical protein
MKNAAVFDSDVQYAATASIMHTKQLAESWSVTSRALTKWIATVRELGYEIGQPGERNRTYYNDVDQDLIKNARYGTLTPNPNSENSSENVPRTIEEELAQQKQEAATEATQNRNLELQIQLNQTGGSQLLTTRQQQGYEYGAAIAKAEFASTIRGYAETKVAVNVAFEQWLNENDIPVGEPQPQVGEAPTPKQLLAGLF